MDAHEKRVSQASAGSEGLAHSHTDRIPPDAAGRFHSLSRQEVRISSSDEGATPADAQSTSGSLSEAQLATFWSGIVANLDAARHVARKIVSPQNVDDVVHTGAVRFVESLQGTKASPFPATDGELRARFLDIVRRYTIDCVRDSKRPPLPTHAHWGVVYEPVVRGHNVADRELDSVFARNDEGKYDAPSAVARREQDEVEQLRQILERHLDDLSEPQREILVESFFEGGKRADIAAHRGITVSTYDNHRQAAFKALRESLAAEAKASTGIDRSIWYDRVEELIERRAARLQDRSSSKKGKSSTSKGERANSEGERGNSRDERRHVEGERSNSAHERGNNQPDGDADEPVAPTSPGARGESELARQHLVRRSLQSGRRTRRRASATPQGTT